MKNAALVKVALATLSCTQKELAARMGTTPAQIGKWKNGADMSIDEERRLGRIAGIGGRDPEFILMAGSIDAAAKWEDLIRELATDADESGETGYITAPLQDEIGNLGWHVFHTLTKMGVEIPSTYPESLVFAPIEEADDEDGVDPWETKWDAIHAHPVTSLICSIFRAYVDVYGFYVAYLSDIIDDDDLDLFMTEAQNIEPCLFDLAAAKVEADPAVAKRFADFKYETLDTYRDWITLVKETAIRAHVPLRAELMLLVNGTHDEIGQEAERESLGLNDSRIHPDIYTNEILVGMRILHQILPSILKKLDIDDIRLDTSELSAG